MNIFEVGGAVRDSLLGLAVQDRDFVVVGATPEQMIAAGYLPVGADFPVFLHPQTHHEYALARTERKTAPGYKGFVFHTDPTVTLEQDLGRRDLTVNAMARDPGSGELIDPFGGRADLEARILRHVGEAFTEDPVRILRVARFAARFAQHGFRVADGTMVLMTQMVAAGEADHLVPERVWQEISRGLMETTPSVMFQILRDCGALERIAPELQQIGSHALALLDGKCTDTVSTRYAILVHALAQPAIEKLNKRLRVPGDCADLALLTRRWHDPIAHAAGLTAEDLLELLAATDAIRRPARFNEVVNCSRCLHALPGEAFPPGEFLATAIKAIASLDYQNIVDAGIDIPQRIRQRRLDALHDFLHKEQT